MKTILIADDIGDLRQLTGMTLEPLGHRMVYADHGVQALELARSLVPDLLVLDVMMPGLDGYAICSAIRADPVLAHMLVLMLTARGQRSDIARGLEAGADMYIVKPFSPVELLDAASALLQRGASS